MALQARLALLEQLRQDLAHNIAALGVPASATETLEVLVPKVLLALSGTEGFTASILPEWDVSYGVFSTGETVSMEGMVTVASASRIVSLAITVSGTGVSTLTPAGAGWDWTKAGNTLTGTFASGGVLTAQAIDTALGRVSFAGDGATAVSAAVTVAAQGASGAAYQVPGTAEFVYAYTMSWELLQTFYPTWAAMDGKTWDQLTTFTKGG